MGPCPRGSGIRALTAHHTASRLPLQERTPGRKCPVAQELPELPRVPCTPKPGTEVGLPGAGHLLGLQAQQACCTPAVTGHHGTWGHHHEQQRWEGRPTLPPRPWGCYPGGHCHQAPKAHVLPQARFPGGPAYAPETGTGPRLSLLTNVPPSVTQVRGWEGRGLQGRDGRDTCMLVPATECSELWVTLVTPMTQPYQKRHLCRARPRRTAAGSLHPCGWASPVPHALLFF